MDEAPLAGIRVLDLSRVLAGPWATQLLADLGAEVIKVERPGIGDDTRSWGPPWFRDAAGAAQETSYFVSVNRGKRSVAIDFTTPEGAEQVRALAATSDVVVENFKLGDLDRYGLDAATLTARDPRLVYCSISGFGRTGPEAARPGYDFVAQAMGGLMSVTGSPDGQPTRAGVALIDIMTGLYAANGILAALRRRERTGRGGQIEVALFDTAVATLANQAAACLATGVSPMRAGNAHPSIVPYQTFRCADGDVAVAVGNDRQFRAFCTAIGRTDLGADPAYATNAQRVAGRVPLLEGIAAALAPLGVAEVIARLDRVGVPAGPVNDVAAALASPLTTARALVIPMAHTALGEVPGIACPIRIDGAAAVAVRGVPRLGEDDAALPELIAARE